MKRSLSLLLLIFAGWQTSIAQTADITQGCEPLTVQFTAPPGSPTYFWVFQDGASSPLENPTNIFVDPATYVVNVFESDGGPFLGSVTIEVYPTPTPTFTADPESGCAPLSVSFQDITSPGAGINITGYTWVFGDGGFATGANPNHVFTTGGFWSVSLEIQTNLPSCNVTQFYDSAIVVADVPVAAFSTTPFLATACDPPLEVSFTNNSTTGGGITYAWDFGNGNTSTDQNPSSETFSANGDFTVALTVTNDLGCETTYQQQVSIGTPETEFIIPDTVCIGESLVMDNQSSTGFYQWAFEAGNIPVASTLQNPLVLFNQPGVQDVTLTTTSIDGQCSSSLTTQILVEEPSAEFTSLPDFSCSMPMDVQFNPLNTGYESYSWIFGDSATSTLVNPNYVYEFADTLDYSWNGVIYYTTELAIVSSAGCVDTVQHVDTLWLPNAVFFPDVVDGCAPLTVTFSDSSTSHSDIVSWEWHLGDGTVVNATDTSSQSVTYTVAGHYGSYLIITNANGCADTSYTVITEVGDQLNPSFAVDVTQVCPGDEIQFTNTSPSSVTDSVDVWHYYSETNRQFHCFDDPDPTWTYTAETGPMSVTLMVGFNGCYSTTTVSDMIQVDGPIAELFFTCECDQPFDIEFENRSHDFTDVVWDFGDGNTSIDNDPTHTYTSTGDFTVVLTANNTGTGCPTSYDTAVVHIRDIGASFQSDTLLCQNVPSSFGAGLSQDVHAVCWGGYTWQFDDPTMRPITTTDPDHPIPFPNSGDVGVTLIVTDINGCTDTARTDVRVFGIDAAITASEILICAPTDVDFTDLTTADTTVASWFWSFGDLTFGVDQSPTHIYNNFQNTIDVFMVVSDVIGCFDTAEVSITMYEPVSTVTSSPFFANICVGQSINFFATDFTQGGSNLTWEWDFMDGGGTSTDQNPSHTFNSSGSFQVTLDYEEISSGCFGATTHDVNVQDYPIADFSNDGDGCAGNVTFTDETTANAPYTTQWDLGNGTTGPGNPISTFYASGSYEVELIVNTSYGCSNTITQQYEVIDPVGQFDAIPDVICRGEEITFTITDSADVFVYTWDFGDGTSAMNQSPITHTYTFVPPSGETVAKLVVTGPGGECPSTFTVPIFIHEVVAGFQRNDGIDTALCFQPFPITNTSLNSDVFYWDFGDGNTSTIEEPGEYEFPSPGTYEVLLGVLNLDLGCNDTIVKTVVLHPYPVLEAIGDTICEDDIGDLSVLEDEPTATYLWTSVIPVADNSAPFTTSQPQFTAQYQLSIIDTNSCETVDTAIIHVINPLILSDWDTIIVIGDSICLPMDAEAGLYIFEWTPSDGLDCDTCASPCLRPLELVMYSVQVSDVLGCFTDEADYTVDIYPETFISFPTTFTPNGDGPNDLIFVEGWGIKDLIEYRIFNRWGEELFFTQEEEEGWDGTYKGVLQNNDVYVYKIKALTWLDETQTLEGYFNLMR